jgi:hypothetical protein
MASTVTYKGPKDPTDGTNVVTVDDEQFPVDQPVKDVTDTVVKRLKAMDGHEFDIRKENS